MNKLKLLFPIILCLFWNFSLAAVNFLPFNSVHVSPKKYITFIEKIELILEDETGIDLKVPPQALDLAEGYELDLSPYLEDLKLEKAIHINKLKLHTHRSFIVCAEGVCNGVYVHTDSEAGRMNATCIKNASLATINQDIQDQVCSIPSGKDIDSLLLSLGIEIPDHTRLILPIKFKKTLGGGAGIPSIRLIGDAYERFEFGKAHETLPYYFGVPHLPIWSLHESGAQKDPLEGMVPKKNQLVEAIFP